MILKNRFLIFIYFLLLIITFIKIENTLINKTDFDVYLKVESAGISINTGFEFGGKGCDIVISEGKYLCEITNLNKYDNKMIIVGDSHARHYYYGLNELSKKEKIGFAIFQLPTDCNIIDNYPNLKKCNELIAKLTSYIKRNKIDKIVFSYKWELYNSIHNEQIENKINKFLENFKFPLKILIFLDNIEIQHHSIEICLSDNAVYKYFKIDRCLKSFHKTDKLYEYYEKINHAVLNNTSKITKYFINPNDYICKNQICYTRIDDKWIFSDRHHLSNFGSSYIINSSVDKIIEFINL